LAFTVRQDISVQAGGVNPEVAGVNIYYKLNASTYWKKFLHNFDGSYQFGNNYTFTPGLDLGVGNPSETNASDNFDFIFRFVYRDSSESTVQWRLMNIDIQPNWNPSNVDAIGERTDAYSFLTEEQAPPGAVADTRTMTIGLTQVAYVKGTRTYLQFTINPPDVTNQVNWYGVRIRSRVIPLGATTLPQFDSVDVLNISSPWTFTFPSAGNITENGYYQIAITPLVRYSSARIETYTSWYGEGKVYEVRDTATGFPDATANLNYFTRMNWRTIDTANITNGSIPLPPQDPKISVIRWQRIVNNSLTPRVNNIYYQLEYSIAHITTGSPSVRLYRRCTTTTPGAGIVGSTAKYYGLGRWEYVDITPGTNAQTLANGNVVVNLRCPIAPSEFNSQYLLSSGVTLENSNFAWGAGKKIIEDQPIDVIAVVTVSGSPSTVAIRLPRITSSTVGTATSPGPFNDVTTASLNNYDAGFKRNLTVGTDGARVAITGSAQWTGTSTAASNAYVAPSTNGGNGVL
jgi:hypothetical protein